MTYTNNTNIINWKSITLLQELKETLANIQNSLGPTACYCECLWINYKRILGLEHQVASLKKRKLDSSR